MHDDGLFADLEPGRPTRPTPQPTPAGLADWQIAQLRESLADSGVESMTERQSLVEELVGRPVAALRELTVSEARRLLEALAAQRQSGDGSRSSWDDREGDTWIDRL